MVTPDARKHLGEVIRAARVRVAMSIHQAATHAGMSPTTWGRIERGEDISVRHLTYSNIERVVGWEAGSITRILDGGDPVPLSDPPTPRPPNDAEPADYITIWEQRLLTEIWDVQRHPEFTREDRQRSTRELRLKVAELRAIEDGVRRSA